MKLEQTADGSYTLYVPELDEHYHSVKGALTESQHIFIDMGLKHSTVPSPRILEIGLGQSTKMIGAYIKSKVEAGELCKHYVVEHDFSWINFFKNMHQLSSGTEIVQLDLLKAPINEEGIEPTYVNLYKGFKEKFAEEIAVVE